MLFILACFFYRLVVPFLLCRLSLGLCFIVAWRLPFEKPLWFFRCVKVRDIPNLISQWVYILSPLLCWSESEVALKVFLLACFHSQDRQLIKHPSILQTAGQLTVTRMIDEPHAPQMMVKRFDSVCHYRAEKSQHRFCTLIITEPGTNEGAPTNVGDYSYFDQAT